MTFRDPTVLGWVLIVIGTLLILAGVLGALFDRRTR